MHWGVYSLLGQGEWVMQNQKLPSTTYEWLASTFNPVKFDARTWVATAKAAGMRYITITSRHHDGFSMFRTRATTYNIVDWTMFKRDPMKELADECRRQGTQAVLLLLAARLAPSRFLPARRHRRGFGPA